MGVLNHFPHAVNFSLKYWFRVEYRGYIWQVEPHFRLTYFFTDYMSGKKEVLCTGIISGYALTLWNILYTWLIIWSECRKQSVWKYHSNFCNQLTSAPTFKGSAWWRHQMETFSTLLALCVGNSPVTGEFPSQRPVTRSFDVFFDRRLNKRLSERSRGRWFETPSRSTWLHCNVFHTSP